MTYRGQANAPIATEACGKAVTYRHVGGLEAIEIASRTTRTPRTGEVRIRVVAAAVNPVDIRLRVAGYPGQIFPTVPGMEAAGIVDAVGPDEPRLRVGDRVIMAVTPIRPEGGAQSRFVIAPSASVVTIPDSLPFAAATILPMNGLTALRALELSDLQRGDYLSVTGGAGLLAQYVIAIAKKRGINIISDARRAEMDVVRGYGADLVLERGPDYAARLRKVVPDGVHAVIDTALLGAETFGALREGGVYVPLRGWSEGAGTYKIEIRPVIVSQVLDRTDWLEFLRDMAVAGEIRLRPVQSFQPEQVDIAQDIIDRGGSRVRPVLLFDETD